MRLLRQFMSGQMISLIMGDCGSGMGKQYGGGGALYSTWLSCVLLTGSI